ncbi:hypothetical protein QBC41DRAFT_341963 [Cercophora samala]|uniref:Uncharacterized protein n=1 Tax=Cercophora samala TaxID=330535 RepID=A0AA39ZNU1_9PEZI|nr:hypothetical protein QBC41DRAFT_341963 [Cercophora samala]
MKFLATLLTLAATASAVDLYLHVDNDCGSSGFRCTSIGPNSCCGTISNNSPYQSVSVRDIQQLWNIQCLGYDGGMCNRRRTISDYTGGDFICNRSNGFRYTGVEYRSLGWERATGSSASALKEEEEECQRPDALVLGDGSEFDLAGLSDEEFDAL